MKSILVDSTQETVSWICPYMNCRNNNKSVISGKNLVCDICGREVSLKVLDE